MTNTWLLDNHAPHSRVASPCVDALISPLINALGEPDFAGRLVTHINELTAVDFFSVYQIRSQHTPQMFLSSSRSGHDVSFDCFRSYQQRLHTQDHTFDEAFRVLEKNRPAMVYAHSSHFAPAHRAAIYSRHGIQDRVSVVSQADSGLILATNFYRFEQQPIFTDTDIDALQLVAKSVANCVSKHIHLTADIRANNAANVTVLTEQLAAHCPSLSARELQVCKGLLLGLTYSGIAADMGVSLATAKTYRARAFDKLGINFRSQLFSIATGWAAQRH